MRRLVTYPRVALKLRRWRYRVGISAPRVSVRTHIAWPWRVSLYLIGIALSFALAGWAYDTGRRFAGFDQYASTQQRDALQDQIEGLEEDRQRLRSLADSSESRLQIELAAEKQLIQQIKTLEIENAQLKEDLSFFESLAQSETNETGLSIPRLRLELEDTATNQYRYRMLVAVQGRKGKEFSGEYRLLLNTVQDGKMVEMVFPAASETNSKKFHLSFKYFQRVDGHFRLPVGARLKGIEARLLQNGAVLATRAASL